MSITNAKSPYDFIGSGSTSTKPSGLGRVPLLPADGSESARTDRLELQSVFLDQTRDAVLTRDLGDCILSWNKGAERLYGWQASEALGQNVYELLRPRHVMGFGDSGRSLAERGEWTGEIHQLTKHGREIIVESRWKLMRDEAGQPKSVLMVNTDVTERKALESQFVRAQRMDSIGKMAVGVAHDLNNVLSLMLVAFHQFQRKELDPDSQRWMKVLSINAEHAGHLITQLLLFGKGVDEERVSIKPKRLIKETVGMLKTVFPKSIEIKTSIASKLWPIVGRATHLRQVLMNLCLNAIDAMPGGGTLTIEATNVELMQGYTSPLFEVNPGKYVLIKFSDSGVGIPGEIIDKVFEPFFTTKEEKGLGLGLAAVLRIVKSDGGFIRVLSEPALGTEFSVYLPSGI